MTVISFEKRVKALEERRQGATKEAAKEAELRKKLIRQAAMSLAMDGFTLEERYRLSDEVFANPPIEGPLTGRTAGEYYRYRAEIEERADMMTIDQLEALTLAHAMDEPRRRRYLEARENINLSARQ